MDPREAGRVELFERALMEAPTALSFIGERLAELAEDARPTPEERDDLSRRMWAALSPPNGERDEESWFIVTKPNEAGTETVRFMLPRASAQARVWPRVFREWQLERVPGRAARAVLNAADADARATLPAAEGELTRVIREALPGLLAAVGDPPAEDANARVIAWLKDRPLAKGANIAAKAEAAIRDWPAEKWADPWTAARFIGGALWPTLRNNLPSYTRPGLPSEVLSNLATARHLQRDTELSRERSLAKGTAVTTWAVTRDGKAVVGLDVSSLEASLLDPKLLRGLTLHKLLRFVMHRSHDLYVELGGGDTALAQATRVTVRGGWRGLAKEIGEGAGANAARRTELTARALQAAWVRTPVGEGGLLMVHHEHRGPGRPFEEVTITLNEKGPFSPFFAVRELHGRSTKIIPIPLPSLMPPMVGRYNEHGAIANLQGLVLRELGLKATQLVEYGGVAIPRKRWEELLTESGVPIPLLDELLKAWCDGDKKNEVPAFITREGDMVNLAPAYAKERLFLEDGGKLSLAGKRRGRAPKRLRGGKK